MIKCQANFIPLFAISLAQHYGLPSPGLDVTDKISVALFFALMKFKKQSTPPYASYERIKHIIDYPVIYILVPPERFHLNYDSYRPQYFPLGRPDAQSAKFMHTGWGYNMNTCARSIFLALYLDPDGNFGPLPLIDELFPKIEKDFFAQFLFEVKMKYKVKKKSMPVNFNRFMDEFYVVT